MEVNDTKNLLPKAKDYPNQCFLKWQDRPAWVSPGCPLLLKGTTVLSFALLKDTLTSGY